MKTLRRIFRPAYGEKGWRISPRRWWSRRDRRSAALAGKILDFNSEEIHERVHRQFMDEFLYGTSFYRVDPRSVFPSDEGHDNTDTAARPADSGD